MKKLSETMWAIKDPHIGFLCGTYLRKKDAIKDYVMTCSTHPVIKEAWQAARNRGIRVVKVKITEV